MKSSLERITCPRTRDGYPRIACTRLLSLLLLLMLPAVVQAQFSYWTNNGTITISGYYGPGGDVLIPDKIDGLPVTWIGDEVFAYCSSLTSVTIPNSVTTIGYGAFYECSCLTSVTIPESVTLIGDWAFYECSSLTSVTIPNSVTTIGEMAFCQCYRLTNAVIGNSVTSIGDDAFGSCCSLTSLVIGNSVSSIGWGAFSGCTSLTSVTIPDSVTSIGDWAFGNCWSLTSIVIGKSVTSIGGEAFSGCTSLTSVHFGGNAPSAGGDVFYAADNATVYYLPGTTGWGPDFGGRPTVFWHLPYPVILSLPPAFGVQNNQFVFRISWATNADVEVEAATNLTNPGWVPVGANTITMGVDPLSDGWSYFSDPDWTNHPGRFYRVRSL